MTATAFRCRICGERSDASGVHPACLEEEERKQKRAFGGSLRRNETPLPPDPVREHAERLDREREAREAARWERLHQQLTWLPFTWAAINAAFTVAIGLLVWFLRRLFF